MVVKHCYSFKPVKEITTVNTEMYINKKTHHFYIFIAPKSSFKIERTTVIFLDFFITKVPCLFYGFSTFSLSENRKVRLIRVISPAQREIWFERVGVRLIHGSVNQSLLT